MIEKLLPVLMLIVLKGFMNPSSAADIKRFQSKSGLWIITVSGQLHKGDHQKFARQVIKIDRGLVAFSSPGGNLDAGIKIGKMIRLIGLDTLVLRHHLCASSCALAWLAGEKKFMENDSRIGFHAAYQKTKTRLESSSVGNALIGSYLSKLGLSRKAIIYISQTHHTKMRWLNAKDAATIGIHVRQLSLSNKSREAGDSKDNLVLEKRKYPKVITANKGDVLSLQKRRERRAISFILNYFEALSSSNKKAIEFIRKSYSNGVKFYGKQKSLSFVIAEKQKIFRKWPKRHYQLRSNDFDVDCSHEVCKISGLLNWKVANLDHTKRATGVASFQFEWDSNLGTINSENGETWKSDEEK